MNNFSFTVDVAYNKANNEYFRDVKRMQQSAFVLAGLLVVVGVVLYLWLQDRPYALLVGAAPVVMAIVTAAVGVAVPRTVGTPQSIYDRYPLVPAIVVKVNPRDMVIMALVDASMDPAAGPTPALACRTVTKLAGYPKQVGTKVPCVAVFGRRAVRSTTYDEITPMPIGWATDDPATRAAATAAISQEDWRKLNSLRDRVDEVLATPFNLLILDK